MFWPNIFISPDSLITLNTCSLLSLGGSHATIAPASSTFAYGVNGAIFIPFRIPKTIIVQNLSVQNGSAVSGNIDIGIYSSDGTRLVSTGSTAQAGVSSVQSIGITPTQIGPGLFYLALAMSNVATARILVQIYSPIKMGPILGMATMASAFPLPATATFASLISTTVTVPQIGLTARAFV